MTITVTPTVDLANTPPRVQLNVSASAGETSTTVTRLDPTGNTVPVRTSDGNPLVLSAGSGLLYDYEMPYGTGVSYSSLESPATVSAQVTVAATSIWLIHPGVPSLSQPVELRRGSFAEETFDVAMGVFHVFGRENPVTITDGARQGLKSTLIIVVESAVQRQSLKALFRDAGVLLLNIPATIDLGLDLDDVRYIAAESITRKRISDIGSDPNRDLVVQFYTVDRPVGGSQAQRTWADVVADNATWADVMARYSTWNSLLAGP